MTQSNEMSVICPSLFILSCLFVHCMFCCIEFDSLYRIPSLLTGLEI